MENNSKNPGAGILFGILVGILVLVLMQCGKNDYERTAKSAYSKFTSGKFSEMTEAEKAHINGFLNSLG